MKSARGKLSVYTVVEVWRGVAADARNFRRLRNAEKYARRLRRKLNMAEDDVQFFNRPISLTGSTKPKRS